MRITAAGYVGIGTVSPERILHVANASAPAEMIIGNGYSLGGYTALNIGVSTISNGYARLQAVRSAGNYWGDICLNASGGNVGIGTNSPVSTLHVNGTATVKILTITGGADVAEPFAMSSGEIPKGAVVVIDEANPGQLKLSDQPYDTKVAGIVSGANGVNPGISLSQEGLTRSGQNVALSGRVYALADATEGAIEPGDMLTTSPTPGHAMKVMEPARAQGAILGKAMGSLEHGKGLVLVLVTLQ